MTDEEYVRANWKKVEMAWGDCGPCTVIIFRTRDGHNSFVRDEPEQAWAAAAEFTRDWLEQIRQRQEEIEEVLCARSEKKEECGQETAAIYSRILVCLDFALADLKRGMLDVS